MYKPLSLPALMPDGMYTIVRLDQLQAIVADTVRTEFAKLAPPPPTDDSLIGSDEACKIYGVSKVTLHKWKTEGRVKFYRIGTRIRYKKSDLLAALETTKKYGRK